VKTRVTPPTEEGMAVSVLLSTDSSAVGVEWDEKDKSRESYMQLYSSLLKNAESLWAVYQSLRESDHPSKLL
jgi:hypothetical protein